MRSRALLCVALVGCAGNVNLDRDTNALIAAHVGCWELTTINFRSPYLPVPTRIRLDSIPSAYDNPAYNQLERLTAAPADIPLERNYWYINPGDRHVIMKLGDGPKGVWIDAVPEADGKRMYGRVGDGATVRATRIDCPRSESEPQDASTDYAMQFLISAAAADFRRHRKPDESVH